MLEDSDAAERFFEKLRESEGLSDEEKQEQTEALIDEIVHSTDESRDVIANNTGREAQDATVEELADRDHFHSSSRNRLSPQGVFKLVDENGKKAGVGWDFRESEYDAVAAGEFCARCLQPQTEVWTERCQPKNLGGKALSCGWPRGRM